MKRNRPIISTRHTGPFKRLKWSWVFFTVLALVALLPAYTMACTVTTTADSGANSLRECINYANANPGETIVFDIPAADPGYVVSGSDSWWRLSLATVLPVISASDTTIDGTTQTVNRGDTNSLGPEIEIEGSGLTGSRVGLSITGGNAVIRGLAVNRFSNNGVQLELGGGNMIQECYIGLDPTGTLALGNNLDGISIANGSSDNTIGGPGVGNVISDNRGIGINIAFTSGNVIQGNLVGTDPTGINDFGNNMEGVTLNGAFDNTVGGQGAGEGNIVAFNGQDGVWVIGGSAVRNRISGNSIFSNSGLGIDLAPNGVGVGTGANNNKSAPVINSVAGTGFNSLVTVTSTAGDTIEFFRVGNDAAPPVVPDASGSGEGFLYLGSCADNGGCSGPYMGSGADADAAAGSVRATILGTVLNAGDALTATATDALNNTSEFAVNTGVPLSLVKLAFLASDGSAIPSNSMLPRGTVVKFLVYLDNTGAARTDVSIRDVLDPAFAYSTGSIKVDNNVASGTAPDDIYSAVDLAAPLTDAIDADVASISGTTIDIGDRFVANGRLDIASDRVFALLYTVRVQ